MKRRSFLTGSVAGTLGVVALGADPAAVVKPSLMTTPMVLMAPRADGVEVVVGVSRLCRGWVEWRTQGGEVQRSATDGFGMMPQGEMVIRVRVDGLKPGHRYDLRVVVEAGDGTPAREESAWKSYQTINPAATTAHFVVWNDTHDQQETLKRLHEVTPSADFLLWNGDTCNNWNAVKQLVPTLLNPAGQDISAGRPVMMVWGNHDVRGHWAFRMKDVVATPCGHPYHAFRCGPVAAICLHTGEDKPDDHPSFGGRVALEPLRREQAAWLAKIIEIPEFRDAPYKVVFCHIPLRWIKEAATTLYQKGEYDAFARESRAAWHDALVKWGAQLIISGHTHEDAWLPANAQFPYAQMVSGGPAVKAARWIEGTTEAGGLNIVMRDLDGKVIHETKLAACHH